MFINCILRNRVFMGYTVTLHCDQALSFSEAATNSQAVVSSSESEDGEEFVSANTSFNLPNDVASKYSHYQLPICKLFVNLEGARVKLKVLAFAL